MDTNEQRARQREYEKNYRANNKERTRESSKRYYEKNRDRIIQDKREYRVTNKEQVLQQKKEYYIRNKARIRLRDLKKYHSEGRPENVTNARLQKGLLLTLQQLEAGEITAKECQAFISGVKAMQPNKKEE